MIIAAFSNERWEQLLLAINSIRKQTLCADETIVVIDRNDALLARLKRAVDDVIVLTNAREAGAGGARNTGVEAASGKIVAFLDDDAEAAPDWLERMIPAFDDDWVLGIGGHLEPSWGTPRPRWFPDEFLWVVGCSHPGLPSDVAPVRNLIAASMLMRRDAFLKLGGFRAGFGKSGRRSGTEETELCIRASQQFRGHQWLHHPGARATHHVPKSRTTWHYFLRRCHDEGLAKAAVVGFVGRDAGLSAERRYVLRVLPAGVASGLARLLEGDLSGILRSGAIVAGLGSTLLGYVSGSLPMLLTRRGGTARPPSGGPP